MQICSDPGVGVIKGGWHCGGDPNVPGSVQNAAVSAPSTLVVCVGMTAKIVATGGPTPAAATPFTWKSSDKSKADITSVSSVISGSSAKGEATIEGKAVGKTIVTVTYTCKLGGTASTDVEVNVIKVEIQSIDRIPPRKPMDVMVTTTPSPCRREFP